MPPLHVWDDELHTWVVFDSEQDGEGVGDGGDNGDPPAPRTSSRANRGVPATRYDDVFELAAEIMCPPTVAMALEGVKGAEWAAAMEAELDSLWENNVYEELPRPQGRKVIGTKWVLRVKTDAAGNLDKYKARVVAKGFRQVEGLDYEETYAPTVRFESVRALVAMAASLGWKLDQMDVATAFLYADLEEETYVEIPEEVAAVGGGDRVWRLRKCLYGLKQSPRMWNQTIDRLLKKLGFVQLTTEHGIYVKGEGESKVFLALYVDDLLLVWVDEGSLLSVKGSLSDNYKMKDLGSAEYLLGVEIRRRPGGGYFLVQEKYAQEVVAKFGMGEAKVALTPFEHGGELVLVGAGVEGNPAMAGIPYRSAVGSLMYLAVCTRPDLAMAVSALSSYCQSPQPEHWEAVKRVLRYVKGTVGEGLGYSPRRTWQCGGTAMPLMGATWRPRGGGVGTCS